MKGIVIFLILVAVVTFIVISSMGCHPDGSGWIIWFFVLLGGFCLLGL